MYIGDKAAGSDVDAHVCLEALRRLLGGADSNPLSLDDAQRALHALSLCLSQRVGKQNDPDQKGDRCLEIYLVLGCLLL